MTNEQQRHLVCSSGDGSLTTIDLAERYSLFNQNTRFLIFLKSQEIINAIGRIRRRINLFRDIKT